MLLSKYPRAIYQAQYIAGRTERGGGRGARQGLGKARLGPFRGVTTNRPSPNPCLAPFPERIPRRISRTHDPLSPSPASTLAMQGHGIKLFCITVPQANAVSLCLRPGGSPNTLTRLLWESRVCICTNEKNKIKGQCAREVPHPSQSRSDTTVTPKSGLGRRELGI